MINDTERNREMNRYKNLIHDFPHSDRVEHWETLLKALQQEEGPILVNCSECKKIEECYKHEQKQRKKMTAQEQIDTPPDFYEDGYSGRLWGFSKIECGMYEEQGGET